MRPTVSSESSSTPFVSCMNRTVFAVDIHDDIGFFAVVLLGGRDERSLDPLEHDFLVDVLIAMDRIDDSQNFLGIHGNLSAAYSPAATANQVFQIVRVVGQAVSLTTPVLRSTRAGWPLQGALSPVALPYAERRATAVSETSYAKAT